MAIHPTAIVSPNCKVGKNVHIGAYAVIHDEVILGDNVTIENFCELGISNALCSGKPLIIGDNALIRSHSIFYADSSFGPGLVTGNRVTVREKTTAGNGLQIGTLGDIQGHCSLGDYVRLHSNVHIGQKSQIGNYVWIFPYVVLTNDPHPPSSVMTGCTVDDYAIIATMSVLLPGVHAESDSLIAAGSVVKNTVPSGWVVGGNPAKEICELSVIKLKDGSGAPAYPWRRHFHRGYPEQVIAQWLAEFS